MLGPGVAQTLARTADQLRADMELLDDLAEAELARARDGEGALEGPVVGGVEGHPLPFPLDDDAGRNGLHPARPQTPGHPVADPTQ